MAVSSMATATHLLLRSLFRLPLRLSTAVSSTPFSLLRPKLSFSLLLTRPLSSSIQLCTANSTLSSSDSSAHQSAFEDEFERRENEFDELEEQKKEEQIGGSNQSRRTSTVLESKRKLLNLTVKEKKELGSYANSLGDKLKSQQVGKSGVTENVVFALSETLEANELLKLKIHRSCPGEMEDVVRQLEQATGSVVVGQIGRTVILYRPSLSKLKAEEKKEQARKLFAQKRQKTQTAFMKQKGEQLPRRPGRSGSRRLEKVPS